MDAGCLSTLAVWKRGESIGENIRNRRGGRDAHIQVIWASPRGYRSSSVSEATSTCVACMATGVLLNTTPLTLTSIPALSSGSSRQGCASNGVQVPIPSIARFRRLAYPGHGEVTTYERLGWKSHGCHTVYAVSVGAIWVASTPVGLNMKK